MPPTSPTEEVGPSPSDPVEEEWDRELPVGVQLHAVLAEEEGVRAHIPIRIVDDATGEPIAGARVDNGWESDWPGAEPWEDVLHWSVVTDRDGWALVPSLDTAPWYFVHAAGYAPLGEMSKLEEYRLVRGVDVTLEIRDWRERPVPGAVVEALLGCGHTPTFQTATADARGRLVFRSIDPTQETDLWVRTPGLAGRNGAYWGHGPGGFPEEDGVRILRGDPSAVLEGRVLRPDGSSAPHAVVGTREAHRGPWTVADRTGRYRLVGARPHETLLAVAPLSDPVPEGFQLPQVEFRSVPGVFATVRLPSVGEDGGTLVSSDGRGIRVQLKGAPGVVAHGRTRIIAVREGDGAAVERFLDFEEDHASNEVALAPGTWTVTIGSPAGLLRPATRRIEVRAGWSDAAFAVEANPTWNPRVVDVATDGTETELPRPRPGKLLIITDDGAVEATPHRNAEGADDGAIHVPAAGPFAVEFLADDGWLARVLLDGPPSGPGPALVRPRPEPQPEWLDEETRAREFAPARLVVLRPDGTPAVGADVDILSGVTQPSDPYAVRRGEERSLVLDDEGAAVCAFDRGDRVTVTARGDDADTLVPLVARIDGPGPWTLRWPDTEIVVRAVDESDVALSDFTVVLSGWGWIDPAEGETVVRLRGTQSGPLRLWVGADGCRTHDVRLLVTAGERREVVVRMNRAAPLEGTPERR